MSDKLFKSPINISESKLANQTEVKESDVEISQSANVHDLESAIERQPIGDSVVGVPVSSSVIKKSKKCIIADDFEESRQRPVNYDRGDEKRWSPVEKVNAVYKKAVQVDFKEPKPWEVPSALESLTQRDARLKNHLKWLRAKEEKMNQLREKERQEAEFRRQEEIKRDQEKRQREKEKEARLKAWQEQKAREKDEKRKEEMMLRQLEEEMKNAAKQVDKNKILEEWAHMKNVQKQMELQKKLEATRMEEEQKAMRQTLAKISYEQWKERTRSRSKTLPKNGYEIFGPKPQLVVQEDWNNNFTEGDMGTRESRHRTRSNSTSGRKSEVDCEELSKNISIVSEMKTRNGKNVDVQVTPGGTDVRAFGGNAIQFQQFQKVDMVKQLQKSLEDFKKIYTMNQTALVLNYQEKADPPKDPQPIKVRPKHPVSPREDSKNLAPPKLDKKDDKSKNALAKKVKAEAVLPAKKKIEVFIPRGTAPADPPEEPESAKPKKIEKKVAPVKVEVSYEKLPFKKIDTEILPRSVYCDCPLNVKQMFYRAGRNQKIICGRCRKEIKFDGKEAQLPQLLRRTKSQVLKGTDVPTLIKSSSATKLNVPKAYEANEKDTVKVGVSKTSIPPPPNTTVKVFQKSPREGKLSSVPMVKNKKPLLIQPRKTMTTNKLMTKPKIDKRSKPKNLSPESSPFTTQSFEGVNQTRMESVESLTSSENLLTQGITLATDKEYIQNAKRVANIKNLQNKLKNQKIDKMSITNGVVKIKRPLARMTKKVMVRSEGKSPYEQSLTRKMYEERERQSALARRKQMEDIASLVRTADPFPKPKVSFPIQKSIEVVQTVEAEKKEDSLQEESDQAVLEESKEEKVISLLMEEEKPATTEEAPTILMKTLPSVLLKSEQFYYTQNLTKPSPSDDGSVGMLKKVRERVRKFGHRAREEMEEDKDDESVWSDDGEE